MQKKTCLNEMGGADIHTLPVAPQQASLASSMTTLISREAISSAICCAINAPDMPLPIITISAVVGNSLVVRWPKRNFEGSQCQKDLVGCRDGKPDPFSSLGVRGIVDCLQYPVA